MTSANDFDQATYHRDVIERALARQLAPRDLVIRYAITGECTVIPAAFSKRVGEVTKYWRSIQGQPRYKKLINELLVAHDDLAAGGQLSYAAFVRHRDEDRARAAGHLETRARDLAAMTEFAGPDMLEALRAETGWLLPDADVRAAVRRHGVSIADEPWELPPRPDRHCRSLARELTTLG